MFNSMMDMMNWVDTRLVVRIEHVLFDLVFLVTIWVIQTFQNAILFRTPKPKKQFLFDSIDETSFRWFIFRNSNAMITGVEWLQKPIMY